MEYSFLNLLLVSAVAFTVPYLLGLFPKLRLPSAVAELIAGIVLGPSVLGWVHLDVPVEIMATIGVAFLLFLAGMELDTRVLKGAPMRLGAIGFGVSLSIAMAIELAFEQAGLVKTPLLVAVILSATSVGIIIPALRDTGSIDTDVGRFTVAGGSVAEFGTIALLGLFFTKPGWTPEGEALMILVLAALAVLLLWVLSKFSRLMATKQVFGRLDDSSSQVRVRLAAFVMLGAAVVAGAFGFEAILGAFLAGAVLAIIIREWEDEAGYRRKLEAAGFGFFVPVFFIASGLKFDFSQLGASPFTVARVFVLLIVLLMVRGLPALLYRKHLTGREMLASGLLQATNLAFVLIAVEVGERVGALTASGGEALIAAGLLSAVLFPPLAQTLLGGRTGRSEAPAGKAEDEVLEECL